VNAGRSIAPEAGIPPILEDGSLAGDSLMVGDSLLGGDTTDALTADGEDDETSGDGSDDGGAVDGGAVDGGSADDGYAYDDSVRIEKGEPMLFTTTSMPLDGWYSQYEDLSGLAFLRVDLDATDESAGLVFEGIVRQSRTTRSVWIGEHVYAVAPTGIMAINASSDHEIAGSVDFGLEPGANESVIVYPAVYWRGMEPMMASAGQNVEAAAETAMVDPSMSPSPWDDSMLSDVLRAAVADLAEQLETPTESIRLVTAECAGVDEATGEKLYDMVFSVNGTRHHVHTVVATDGSVTVEQFTPNYEFSTQSLVNEWHNGTEPCDVDGDGLVAPIDALNVINELNVKGSYRLGGDRPLRAISARPIGFRSAFDPIRIRFDTNGDSLLAPIDALIVINRLNTQTLGGGQAAGGAAEGEGLVGLLAPSTLDTASWLASAVGISSMAPTAGSSPLDAGAGSSNASAPSVSRKSVGFQDAAVRDGVLAAWDAAGEAGACLGTADGGDGSSADDGSLNGDATDAALASI